MKLKIQKYLFDIKVYIDSIEEYLEGRKDFTVYSSNKILRRVIEREFEIIGEATNKILKLYPEISIEGARRIVNLRNWVIHSYDAVDDVIIWGIVTKHVPILKEQVEKTPSRYF